MTRRTLGLALALGCLLVPAWALRAEKPAAAVSDAQFAMQASATDLAEVNLGRIAAQRAGNADVKQFAQRMIDEHSKSSNQMLALANKKGTVRLAERMDPMHQTLATRLLQLSGANFDREYMTHMVEGHRKAVALFEAEAQNGKDPELKAFAAKTLPTIKEHLKMAEDISNKLNGGGK